MKKSILLFFCAFLVFACADKKTTPASEGTETPAPTPTDEEMEEEEDMEEEVAEESYPIIDGINAGSIFKQSCSVCHGLDGKLGANGSKDLSVSVLPIEERVTIITNGKGLMTPFGSILSAEEIQAVAKYTLQLKK